MDGILDVRLKELHQRLEDRKMTLKLDSTARTWLCDRGYEPAYGARPLNRVVARYIMNPLAKALLEGSVRDGEQVAFEVHDDLLTLIANHEPES